LRPFFTFAAQAGTANAAVIYDLTLAATSGGAIGGTGTMMISGRL
jgi:hypothetical protein